MPYYFLAQLRLTEQGRSQPDNAAANLQAQRDRIVELGGTVTSLFVTFGRFDAVIAGEIPDIERLTYAMANLVADGYYTSEISVGVEATSYTAKAVPTGHHT